MSCSNVTSTIKRKPVYSDARSPGLFILFGQPSETVWLAGEWWSVLNGGLWWRQWRGALARSDCIISALAWLSVLIHSFLFRMIQRWESKCREPKRRDLESHSTFWKLGKIMDYLDPWYQEKIGIHINADFAYNFGVYRPTEASLHTLS